MKSSVRSALSLFVTGASAAISFPAMFGPMRDAIFPSLMLDQQSYFSHGLWQASITLLVCDLIRQIVLRRLFPIRFTLEIVLIAAAWFHLRYGIFPVYEVFVIMAGYMGAYVLAMLADLQTISRGAVGEGRPAEQSFFLVSRPSLIWLGLAFCSLFAGHSSAFLVYIPQATERLSHAGIRLMASAGGTARAGQWDLWSQEFMLWREYVDRAGVINAVLVSASFFFFFMAIYEAYKRPNKTPLRTPGSVTSAAGAPVAPPPGIAGR